MPHDSHGPALELRIHPVLSAIKAMAVGRESRFFAQQPTAPPEALVTISRQPGAGGETFADMLVARLNAAGEEGWTVWDRELIEKVAADHHIATRLIESLEDSARSWLSDLFGGFSLSDDRDPDELVVYHRVATTIRCLAATGRVVVVGRAGVFITRNMPGGIHLRLIAPLEDRVRRFAREFGLDPTAAARRVNELDKARASFYHRYWPNEALSPDRFTLTLNTARIDDRSMVECVVPLVRRPSEAMQNAAVKGACHVTT